MMVHQRDHDRGAATVLAAMLSLFMTAILSSGLMLGGALIARHRADGAADLAALAAAAHAPQGRDFACGRAERVVREMNSVIVNCELGVWDARVQVRASAPVWGRWVTVGARARAGPVADP